VQYEPPAIVGRDRIEGVLSIVGSPTATVSASFRRASTAPPEARDDQAGAR
jgi:hypothetical protein